MLAGNAASLQCTEGLCAAGAQLEPFCSEDAKLHAGIGALRYGQR